jgi:hypothetical protein
MNGIPTQSFSGDRLWLHIMLCRVQNILLVSMRISCIYINPNLITIVRVIVFNNTFNNISVLSCRSVFLIRAVMITMVTKTCSPIVILQRTKESLYSSHTNAMSSKADHARCTRHNIMCNQSLSPLKLWVGITFMYLIQPTLSEQF